MSKFINDLIITGVTSILTIICLVISTRFLAVQLGEAEFGVLAVIRRLITLLEPICTLGLALTLTKEIATCHDLKDRKKITFCSVVLIVSFNMLFLIFSEILLRTIGAPLEISYYIQPIFLIVIFYSLFLTLYTYYRGSEQIAISNVLQIIAVAVAPLIAAYQFTRIGGLIEYLYIIAAIFALVSLPLVKLCIVKISLYEVLDICKRLLKHSIPRIFGPLIFGLVLGFGVFVAPYTNSVAMAGYIAIAFSFWKVIEGITESFGRVAYPKLSKIVYINGYEPLIVPVSTLTTALIHAGSYATIHMIILTNVLVAGWLGDDFIDAVPVVKILNIAILPYLYFVTTRPIIEVLYKKPAVTYIVFLSTVVILLSFSILIAIGYAEYAAIASIIIGIYVIGIAAHAAIIFRVGYDRTQLKLNYVLAILSLQFIIAFYFGIGEVVKIANDWIVLLIFEAISFCTFIVLLRYLNVRWVSQIIPMFK